MHTRERRRLLGQIGLAGLWPIFRPRSDRRRLPYGVGQAGTPDIQAATIEEEWTTLSHRLDAALTNHALPPFYRATYEVTRACTSPTPANNVHRGVLDSEHAGGGGGRRSSAEEGAGFAAEFDRYGPALSAVLAGLQRALRESLNAHCALRQDQGGFDIRAEQAFKQGNASAGDAGGYANGSYGQAPTSAGALRVSSIALAHHRLLLMVLVGLQRALRSSFEPGRGQGQQGQGQQGQGQDDARADFSFLSSGMNNFGFGDREPRNRVAATTAVSSGLTGTPASRLRTHTTGSWATASTTSRIGQVCTPDKCLQRVSVQTQAHGGTSNEHCSPDGRDHNVTTVGGPVQPPNGSYSNGHRSPDGYYQPQMAEAVEAEVEAGAYNNNPYPLRSAAASHTRPRLMKLLAMDGRKVTRGEGELMGLCVNLLQRVSFILRTH
ncbi:hypothetical protein LTS10_012074 [Elasticomyces elasticus]|nr:hypothetical protein LTS10_012074 [Elasticomyces elasticus]